MKNMKMNTLTALILATIPASSVFAAALDRSGQSIAPFFESGNYAEIGGSFLAPDVSGKDKNGTPVPDMGDRYEFWNAALKLQPTEMLSLGLIFDEPFGGAATFKGKNAFTSNGTFGIDGGTAVDVQAKNITALVGVKPVTGLTVFGGAAYQEVEGKIDLRGSTYSAFNGYSADVNKDGAFGWVAGAAYEIPDIALKASITYRSEIEHQASVREAFKFANLLAATTAGVGQADAGLAQINAGLAQITGGLLQVNDGLVQVNGGLVQVNAGLAQDPQNAQLLEQKTQLTAQLNQLTTTQAQLTATQTGLTAKKAQVTATKIGLLQNEALLGVLNASVASSADTTAEVTTPQSVNIDLQSGIMANTIAFANIRWVDWSNFSIRPTNFGKASVIASSALTGGAYTKGFNLVDYSDDQWTVTAGIGRKLSDQLSALVSVGWDSGAGNPVTILGPTEGYWSVGLGLRYSPTPKIDFSAGVKYFWLGDAEVQTGLHSVPGHTAASYAGDFSDNEAVAFGLKMGYHF